MAEQKHLGRIKLQPGQSLFCLNLKTGDNRTMNDTAQKYHDDGYDLDREKSTDRLLVFVKHEEVKE